MVDDKWTTDHTAPTETDEAGNVNNVLLPENMSKPSKPSLFANMISGITPGSTTAQLASKVPKEGEGEPGPEPSAASPPATPFHDAEEFGVNPIPATAGTGNPTSLAPGEKVPHPNTLTSNTINSTVRDDPSLKKEDNQTFGVAPLPATTGIGNPVSLQPGEKVPDPSSFTTNTVTSNVTLDKASYENSGATPQAGTDSNISGGAFSVPPISKNMIPESSLPMGGQGSVEKDPGPVIQSVGAESSTAALAGQVPKEPRGVPEVVSESQQEAGVGPEAAGNQEAVKEKSAMEKELEGKVPAEPAASEGTGTAGTSNSAAGSKVPGVVQESIAQAHQSPEAAANEEVVGEKSAVEKELLKKTPTENMGGEPAPSSTAALTETAPAPTNGSAPVSDNKALEAPKIDSRDVSPMTKPTTADQTQPMVSTGVGSSQAPQVSSPSSPSAAAATDKKSKRASGFFGKLKSKLSHKDKE